MTGDGTEKAPETDASKKKPEDDVPEEGGSVRFPPEEEAALVAESNTIKADANALFSAQDYENAISRYDDAVATCPRYLDYERAVLQSNIAACHLKLEQWTDAAKAATAALDGLAKLEREDPTLNPEGAAKTENAAPGKRAASSKSTAPENAPSPSPHKPDDDDVEEEIVSTGALRSAPAAPSPEQAALDARKADIRRIRIKALLRRARARAEAGGWSNLAGAEEDYTTLSRTPGLAAGDARTVRAQLRDLPPRTKAAQEEETAEMWGKLRNLGDGILKPFGLSTQNFQMVKDEATGGYSMNFNQSGGKS